MKLISMTDFVLETEKNQNYDSYNKNLRYANFLKQPLELWMFVSCKLVDGVWVVLEDTYSKQPDRAVYFNDEGGNPELYQHNMKLLREYQQAKERCLFDGFEFTESQKFSTINKIKNSVHWYTKDRLYLTTKKEDGYHSYFQLFTVENLIQCDLQLTPTAIKQIGL